MVSKRKPAAPEVKPIGDVIDEIFEKREQRRQLDAESKKLQGEIDVLEMMLMVQMDEQKTTGSRGSRASASINETVKMSVQDWDLVWPWVAKTKNFQLVQKRPSDPAYRELRKLGFVIPGAEDFADRSVSVRVLS